MGFGGISIWQLLIILLIVVLVFGTKKLKGMGSDLGGALKGFKDAVGDEKDDKKIEDDNQAEKSTAGQDQDSETTKDKPGQ